jgi:hypothetical protein
MEHDISNMIRKRSKPQISFCIIKPPYQGRKVETMADLALVLDCKVLEGITRTNYDGRSHYPKL